MLATIQPPNVNITCIGSLGVPTEKYYIYTSSIGVTEEGYPQAFCGDGDGTVAQESLSVCKTWGDENLNGGFSVEYSEYTGKTHVGILTDSQVIQDFVNWIQSIL
jgi:hypothetical protein